MKGRSKAELILSPGEREQLQSWARRRKTAQALALRSRINLECARGTDNKRVAARFDVTQQMVSKWRRRFVSMRLDGLLDTPRTGKPRTVEDAQVEAMITRTLESLPKNATHWSTRSMAKELGLWQSAISRPQCDEWWADDEIGLRQKLAAEADLTSGGLSGLVIAIAPFLAGEGQFDAVAKVVLTNAPPSWSNSDLVGYNTGTSGFVSYAEQFIKGGLATGGVVTASALFSVTMTAVLQGLPMVQAVLLLGMYALLPLFVVLSRYSLSMLMIGAMAIFTVKFWTVLWYLALWVDQNLILSMYPDVNVFFQIFANPGEHDAKRMLLNMITMSLYVGLPLLWSGMMAWAGIRVGRTIDSTGMLLRAPAQDSGTQGGNLGRAILARGFRR